MVQFANYQLHSPTEWTTQTQINSILYFFPERQSIGYNSNNRQTQPTQIWSKNYEDSQGHVQSGMFIIFNLTYIVSQGLI